MALAKKTYTDLVTVIPADNLNDIQDSIIALENSKTADEVIIANLRTDVDENTDSIGTLSDLTTESKTDLVSAINEAASSGGGLTDDVKVALLNCFEKVAWTVDNGQDYVDALENALYPDATLVSISAVYTQSGTVYDTDSLDVLKSDLVVTAHYSDSTTETVTTYTLSGTLAEGTSTITVSYGGKTTTFNVTVTAAPLHPLPDKVTETTSYKLTTTRYGHIKFEAKTNLTVSNSTYYGVNLITGAVGTVGSGGANLLNQPTTMYDIPSGEYTLRGTNVSADRSFRMTIFEANINTSAGWILNTYDGTEDVERSTTLNTSKDIGAIGLLILYSNTAIAAGTTIELDFDMYSGNLRYI